MDSLFKPETTVLQVLESRPQTVSVFLGFGTACAGCYLARFCALEDVAAFYQIPLETLLEALNESAQTHTEE